MKAQLDHSVPLVGAPEAWAQGYDGDGVTVAVLDTHRTSGWVSLRADVSDADGDGATLRQTTIRAYALD